MMTLLMPLLGLVFQPIDPGLHRLTFPLPDGAVMGYSITVPRDYRRGEARPLVLALHPGGQRTPYRGAMFAQQIVAPALGGLGAIVVAPDCPSKAWSDPPAEQAVLALLRQVMSEYGIDRSRVLVTGFSLGGRGTWFFASQHPELFTAAIPIAGAPGSASLDRLLNIPVYIIHSRADDVVPFEPAERAAGEIERLGGVVEFEALDSAGHFTMGAYISPLREAGRWVRERWEERKK
jgi:predicted peptidase